jgi:methylated-DNA-[protein]-cysteine S-methyltransferase
MATLRYSKVDSPVGELTIGAGPTGLCFVGLGTGAVPTSSDFELEPGTSDLHRDAAKALSLYFEGKLKTFDLPLDLSLARPFTQKILKLLLEIPYGEVTSYGALAAVASSSARAVGGAVGSNPIPIVIPCHRVVAADGSLGGFSGGLDRKRALLALEEHEPLAGGWAPRRRKVFA